MTASRENIVFGPAQEVLDGVAGHGDRGLAVLVQGRWERVVLAFMSVFGPCVREYLPEDFGDGPDFVAGVVRQTFARGAGMVGVAGDDRQTVRELADLLGRPGEARLSRGVSEALAAFRARRPEVPTSRDGSGRERARGWSVALLGERAFERGDRLAPRLEPDGAGWLVRWRGPGGADAGIHVRIARPATAAEEAVLAGAEGVVLDAIHGAMPGEDGPRIVQTLVIDIPADLARAFPDGRLPRHGGLGPAAQSE